MNILLCCEHFHPSIGGVQNMMLEIGVQFINRGHNVSVATSYREDRTSYEVRGITIHDFNISGNTVKGINGEIKKYQDFLINSNFDCLLVMAAQQWTFDAMLPVLNKIRYKKLHIPCGYSYFYTKTYQEYYSDMHQYLKNFDALIYNASEYRDINYAKEHNIQGIHVIPAGASENEFMETPAKFDRTILNISNNELVFLSVGIPAYHKGHKEVLLSYLKANIPKKSTLILNGDYDGKDKLSDLLTEPRKLLRKIVINLLGRSPSSIKSIANKNTDPNKRIIFTNLARRDLISLYFDADLFLFASHIEYSPIVIFECLASGLPFISIPVGNVKEVVEWSGGGVISEQTTIKNGMSYADIETFSQHISSTIRNKELLASLSKNGRKAWENKFTWDVISKQIEKLIVNNHQ